MPAAGKASYAAVASEDVKTTAPRRKQAAAGVKKPQAPLVKYYLVAYNVLSSLAWGAILLLLLLHIADPSIAPHLTSSAPKASISTKIWSLFNAAPTSKKTAVLDRLRGAYSAVGPLTKVVQTFAALEVVHAATGLVRSPWVTTLAQVASRLWTVWGVVELFDEPKLSPAYSLLIFAWSFTEVVRYAYYALNLLGIEPYPLLWLRYTTFFPLYPLGAGSELWLSLLVLPPLARLPIVGPHIAQVIKAVVPASLTKGGKGLLALGKTTLVQGWDGLDYFRGACAVIWPAALVVMYTYMIGQRKKALRTAKGGKKVGGGEKKTN